MANKTIVLEAATTLTPDDPAMRRLRFLEPRGAAPLLPDKENPGDWWHGLPQGRPPIDDGVPGDEGRFGPGAGAVRGDPLGGLETPWGRMGDMGPLGERGSTPQGWNMGVPRFPRLGGGPPAGSTGDPKARAAEQAKWEAELAKLERQLKEALEELDKELAKLDGFMRLPSGPKRSMHVGLSEHFVEAAERKAAAIYEKILRMFGGASSGGNSGNQPPYGLSYGDRMRLKAAQLWKHFDSATLPSPGTPLVGPDGGRGQLEVGLGAGTVDSRGLTPLDEGGGGSSPWLVPEMHDVTNLDPQSSIHRPTSPQLRGYAQRIFALIDPPRDL